MLLITSFFGAKIYCRCICMAGSAFLSVFVGKRQILMRLHRNIIWNHLTEVSSAARRVGKLGCMYRIREEELQYGTDTGDEFNVLV